MPILRCGHVVASINEKTGGPALSVTRLTQELAVQNTFCHLFTLDYTHLGKQQIPQNVQLHSFPAPLITRFFRGYSPQLAKELDTFAANLDLIHNHGLWMQPNLYARLAAKQNKVPLIISPRGMLEPWSIQRARWKKTIAWQSFEKTNLSSAHLFHATSEAEAQSIRALGFKQPIALIPNGVDLPSLDLDRPQLRQRLEHRFPLLRNRRWLLFLSRLHPKKGLPALMQCWSKLAAKFPDWHLLIAGPDLDGYQPSLQAQVSQLRLEDRVTFTGMLRGEDKAAAFSNADLFVLPSFSENFGIAIAEALSYQVPVITTHGTPWKELVTHSCGWWIENSETSLLETLQEGLQLSQASRIAMGEQGRQLVEKSYAWPTITQKMYQVYKWVLQEGSEPEYIIQ
ncbi:MAG: glycosyltransferase [Anaerolineae bacterium]|nr:glycosyltransferase [Gloeobacterales cyanobacterium ES-bin-313]